jgi:poly [ADP-ribose] polymerase
LKGPIPADSAISEYKKKLLEKTVGGDYCVLEMDKSVDATNEDIEDIEDAMKKDAESCKLPKTVISLISLIFDMKMINN